MLKYLTERSHVVLPDDRAVPRSTDVVLECVRVDEDQWTDEANENDEASI